jgi:hypothetical protein
VRLHEKGGKEHEAPCIAPPKQSLDALTAVLKRAGGDHVSARDGAQLGGVFQAGEDRKFGNVVFVSSPGFRIGDVGDVFYRV